MERGRVARTALVFVVALLGLVAVTDAMSVFSNRATLSKVLLTGIGPEGPTADLPSNIGDELRSLELTGHVQAMYSELSAAEQRYRIGVEVEQRIAGVPVGWTAIREGTWHVEGHVRTLQVFVDGGWTLDASANQALEDYRAQRRLERQLREAHARERREAAERDPVGAGDRAAPPRAP